MSQKDTWKNEHNQPPNQQPQQPSSGLIYILFTFHGISSQIKVLFVFQIIV